MQYTSTGKFVPEVRALAEKFQAEAVILIVFGGTRGSGACCELNVGGDDEAAKLGLIIAEHLRELANSIEVDAARGRLSEHDNDEHQQTLN